MDFGCYMLLYDVEVEVDIDLTQEWKEKMREKRIESPIS